MKNWLKLSIWNKMAVVVFLVTVIIFGFRYVSVGLVQRAIDSARADVKPLSVQPTGDPISLDSNVLASDVFDDVSALGDKVVNTENDLISYVNSFSGDVSSTDFAYRYKEIRAQADECFTGDNPVDIWYSGDKTKVSEEWSFLFDHVIAQDAIRCYFVDMDVNSDNVLCVVQTQYSMSEKKFEKIVVQPTVFGNQNIPYEGSTDGIDLFYGQSVIDQANSVESIPDYIDPDSVNNTGDMNDMSPADARDWLREQYESQEGNE